MNDQTPIEFTEKQIMESQNSAPVRTAHQELIFHALNQNAEIEAIEKLMELQERSEKRAAQQAFNLAMSKAKSEIQPILKRSKVDYGTGSSRVKYNHETLADIDKQVDPVLAKFGLSCRYRSHTDSNNLTIDCIISHQDGHSESVQLSGPSGAVGSIKGYQALGSAVTYLQRYTKKLALGLSAAQDDDGQQTSPQGQQATINEAQFIEIKELSRVKGCEETILTAYGIPALSELPENKFASVKKRLLEKPDLENPDA